MAYLEQGSNTNRPTAIAGVIGIHAVIGYVLVSGLSTVINIVNPPPPLVASEVIELPPPPPKEEDVVKDQSPVKKEVVVSPDTKIRIAVNEPVFDTTPIFDDIQSELVIKPNGGEDFGTAIKPPPVPKFNPISARPRNNPGDWVTKSDYRSSWINRNYTGIAKFKLSVSASGRVESCQIVASTGYPALDEATCNLVQRRARFEAARNSSGERTGGSYSNAVRWELPD